MTITYKCELGDIDKEFNRIYERCGRLDIFVGFDYICLKSRKCYHVFHINSYEIENKINTLLKSKNFQMQCYTFEEYLNALRKQESDDINKDYRRRSSRTR